MGGRVGQASEGLVTPQGGETSVGPAAGDVEVKITAVPARGFVPKAT